MRISAGYFRMPQFASGKDDIVLPGSCDRGVEKTLRIRRHGADVSEVILIGIGVYRRP